MKDQELLNWLRRYGYHKLVGLKGYAIGLATDNQVAVMVRSAQILLGLKADGNAQSKTFAAMARPRCGCPDHMRMPSRREPAFGSECRLSVGVYADWSGIKGIGPSRANEVMVASFAMLDNFNVAMHKTVDKSDALISIRMGPADKDVLAWMQMGDGCDWQHQSLFNIDVNWSDDLLFAGTLVHELLGHGTGVGHGPNNSIMGPTFSPKVPNQIDPWFAAELESRYGLSEGGVLVPKPPTPTPEPNPNPQPPTATPEGVPGMIFEQILAIFLPMIVTCLEQGASDERVMASIRSPNTRQRRKMERGVKRYVRRDEPGLRKRERRAKTEALLDSVIIRGQEASDTELANVIEQAHQQRRMAA